MKKLIFLSAFLISLTSGFSQPLTLGEQAIGFGIGIPATTNQNYSSRSPAFTAIYEYGFTEKIGIGYIGGGALLSFSNSKYEEQNVNTTHENSYNYILMGPRAAYHFDMVELTNNRAWSNIDVYGGAFLGMKFQRHKYTDNTNNNKVKSNSSSLATDIFGGIRYGFNDKIGAFAELGFGVAYLNLGINIRL